MFFYMLIIYLIEQFSEVLELYYEFSLRPTFNSVIT